MNFNPFRFFTTFFIILLTIVAVSLAFFVSMYNFQNKTSSNLEIQKTTVFDKKYFLNKINELQQITTLEMIIDKEIEAEIDFGDFNLPGGFNVERKTKQSILIVGKVKAGINFADLNESDFQINEKEITINLPETKILDIYFDNEKTKLLKKDNSIALNIENILPSKKLELENLINQKISKIANLELKSAACKENIIPKSTVQSKKTFETLFALSGFKKSIIIENNKNECVI